MLKVVQEELQPHEHAPAAVGGSLLDELAREGARQMLATAVARHQDTGGSFELQESAVRRV